MPRNEPNQINLKKGSVKKILLAKTHKMLYKLSVLDKSVLDGKKKGGGEVTIYLIAAPKEKTKEK